MNIRDNLVKAMQSSPAWLALADAIAQLSATVVEPTLDRLKSRTRLFDMHPDDIKVLFDELGTIARIGRTEEIDRPLLLQQRIDEVHQKNYLYPLKKTLQREFSNVRVSWQPLYAPVDLDARPYGTVLARSVDKAAYPDVPDDGWFKTSRGLLQINLEDLYRLYPVLSGADLMDRFVADVDQVLRPLLPTRIVYDGQIFVLQVYLSDVLDSLSLKSIQIDVTMPTCFVLAAHRFGVTPIGSVSLGGPYDHKERKFQSSVQLSYNFGSLILSKPIRHGVDRIGAERLGTNLAPPDTRITSISRTIT